MCCVSWAQSSARAKLHWSGSDWPWEMLELIFALQGGQAASQSQPFQQPGSLVTRTVLAQKRDVLLQLLCPRWLLSLLRP